MATGGVDIDSILNQTVGYIFVGLAFELLCVFAASTFLRLVKR